MSTFIRPCLLLGLLLSLPPAALAQVPDLPYSSGSTGADGPLQIPGTPFNRYGFGSAYDAERDRIVLFGGNYRATNNNLALTPLRDTWLYDGTGWERVAPVSLPGHRMWPAMAYDAVRKEVVMFGGYSRNQFHPSWAYRDTWVWDGTNWTRKFPPSSPPAGGVYHMVWDSANSRCVMVAGRTTWAWDGEDWSEIDTTTELGSSLPDTRFSTACYDTENERVLWYHESLRETWALVNDDWTRLTTTASPDTGAGCRMAYDEARQEAVLFGGGGSAQTWTFKDDDWTLKTPTVSPRGRSNHATVYFASQSKVVAFSGDNGSWTFQDTDTWDGTDWVHSLRREHTFDMTGRLNGVWNYTSIHVPPYTDVYFIKNSTNTPVTWLATEDVTINGRVIISGKNAVGTVGVSAEGGPGGYDGGTGGVPGSLLGLYAGSPGAGPGGGGPGLTIDASGAHGRHRSVYGNALVQPPTGGSGGGGGASDDQQTGYGGNGGAGSGAIVIKSSKNVTISRFHTSYSDGGIYANGGDSGRGVSGSWGGAGSGGSIRVVGDRVSGDGLLRASGGRLGNTVRGESGWIRVESFFNPFNINASPNASVVSPVGSIPFGDQPKLRIMSVAGETVPQPPSALIESPDVIFSNNATPVSIVVFGDNIPVGTEITLTIETTEGTINLPGDGDPVVTLGQDGSAVFNTVLEDGHGTIRAFANYQVTP